VVACHHSITDLPERLAKERSQTHSYFIQKFLKNRFRHPRIELGQGDFAAIAAKAGVGGTLAALWQQLVMYSCFSRVN
jgi:hypothetical protein